MPERSPTPILAERFFASRPGVLGSATVTQGVSIHSPEGLCKISGAGVGNPLSQLVIDTGNADDTVTIDRVLVDGGGDTRGVTVRRGNLTVTNSVVQNSGPNTAIAVVSISGSVKVNLEDVFLSDNGTNALGGGIWSGPPDRAAPI